MTDDTDAFDVQQPAGDLKSLLVKAEELVGIQSQIEDLDQLLKTLNGRAIALKTKEIPEEMSAVGLTEFKTPDGSTIKVEDFVSGSLPKEVEPRAKALGKVVEMGGEGIIKNTITLEFERSQHNEALSVADDLRKQGFDPVVKSDIHPQRYLGWVRECLRNGTEVDAATLGIFVGRNTKVQLKKKK